MPDERNAPLWVMAAAAAAAVVLSGCASQARRGQAALDQLEHALPGVYGNSDGNSAQAAGAAASAVLPVTLSIVPATAQLIGDTVFFVRETAAGNAQLVLWQGVWTLTVEPKPARIVQHIYLLKDPRRWIGAAAHPDMLLSMLPQDLQPLPSCDLVWTRSAAGDFTGTAASAAAGTTAGTQACRPGSQAAGLWTLQGARLSGGQLTLAERRIGADGALVDAGAPLSLVLERVSASSGGSADSSAR